MDSDTILTANPKKCSNTNTLVISLQQIRKQFICLQFVIILILLTTDVEERSAIFSQSSKRTANLHPLFIGNCHIRSGAALQARSKS